MSEATKQAAIKTLLEATELFADGSVLINDYLTPQITSRALAPWAIIALSDDILLMPGAAWSTPTAEYGVHLTLVDYRRSRSDKELLDAFQALRQAVLAAVIATPATVRVTAARANTLLGPYFNEEGEPDPDSMAQRFTIAITDYEV